MTDFKILSAAYSLENTVHLKTYTYSISLNFYLYYKVLFLNKLIIDICKKGANKNHDKPLPFVVKSFQGGVPTPGKFLTLISRFITGNLKRNMQKNFAIAE